MFDRWLPDGCRYHRRQGAHRQVTVVGSAPVVGAPFRRILPRAGAAIQIILNHCHLARVAAGLVPATCILLAPRSTARVAGCDSRQWKSAVASTIPYCRESGWEIFANRAH